MRPTLLTAAVLLLAALPALAAPDAIRYEGAGFAIDVPEGFEVAEGFTGQIYHLDLLHRADPATAGTDFLRLVVVPKTSLTAAQVAERIVADFARESVAAASLLETGSASLPVAGESRTGVSRTFGVGGKPGFRLVAVGIRDGEQKAALVAKISVADEEAERAILDGILADIEIRTLLNTSLIGVRVSRIRLRVPLVTKVDWREEPGRVVGQFQLPEGRMTLVLQDCGTVARADAAVTRAHEENGKNLDLQAIGSGAKVLSRSMTAMPAGDGLATGSAHRLRIPAGNLRDQIIFPLQDGRFFLGLSFLCDEERREGMSARIAQVLGTLRRAEPPHRRPNLYVGHGLRIAHGSRDALSLDDSDPERPRFSLDFEGPFPTARFLLDVGPPEPDESPGATHDRVLLARGAPDEGRETSETAVEFLGADRPLLVTTYPAGGARRFAATAAAPLGDRRLLVTLLGADHVRTDLLLALRAVLGRLSAATIGDVEDGPIAFRFDPRVAELITTGSRTNRRIEFRGDRVRGSLVRLPALVEDPDGRLEDQIRWANRDFEAEERDRGGGEFSEAVREVRTIDDRRVLVSRRTFVGADGRKGAHTALAAVLDGEFLRASVACLDVEDGAALAAADAILGSLRIR